MSYDINILRLLAAIFNEPRFSNELETTNKLITNLINGDDNIMYVKKEGLFGEELDYDARDLVQSLAEKYGHYNFNYPFAGRLTKRYSYEVIEFAISKMPLHEPERALAYLEKLIQRLINGGIVTISKVPQRNKIVDEEIEQIVSDLDKSLI